MKPSDKNTSLVWYWLRRREGRQDTRKLKRRGVKLLRKINKADARTALQQAGATDPHSLRC